MSFEKIPESEPKTMFVALLSSRYCQDTDPGIFRNGHYKASIPMSPKETEEPEARPQIEQPTVPLRIENPSHRNLSEG